VQEVTVKQFVVNVIPVKDVSEKSGEDVDAAVVEWERIPVVRRGMSDLITGSKRLDT
jgi:hypothetical protein